MWETVKDFVLPAAAILVPTGIAIWLANTERRAGERERAEARAEAERAQRVTAGSEVIVSLARFVSADPRTVDLTDALATLRGKIAAYRAWIRPDDLSGDWLALKHTEGMKLWGRALQDIEEGQGLTADTTKRTSMLWMRPGAGRNRPSTRCPAGSTARSTLKCLSRRVLSCSRSTQISGIEEPHQR